MVRKVLAVGAHPDDVELGLGGTIARHRDEGDEVFVLVLSRGEKGVGDATIGLAGLSEREKLEIKGRIREKETKNALKILGIKEDYVKVLGFPDSGIQATEETLGKVSQLVKDVSPDIVYTHFPRDLHSDHVSTSIITIHAGRKVKNLIFYESPSTCTNFSPNFFINISDYIAKKLEALRMHETQKDKPYMERDAILSKARFRGFQAGVLYAEAFVAYRIVY